LDAILCCLIVVRKCREINRALKEKNPFTPGYPFSHNRQYLITMVGFMIFQLGDDLKVETLL
jgi:hypothetical protein